MKPHWKIQNSTVQVDYVDKETVNISVFCGTLLVELILLEKLCNNKKFLKKYA